MHLHRLMGLALLAVFKPVRADASVLSLTLPVSDISSVSGVHPAGESDASVTRYLRTDASQDPSDGEERAGLSEKLIALVSFSKVTPERLQKWLDEGKPAKVVFDRMRFRKSDTRLLRRPQFTEWLKYLDDLNAKNPTKKTSAIAILTAHYGDAALYQMIKSASRYPSMKELASRLQAEQMQYWVASLKSPDDVFRLMKFEKLSKDFLTDPKFIAWAKYVDDFSATYPEKSASMIPALIKYYSDVYLFRIAAAAKSVEETKSIAAKLEDQLIKFWIGSRKSPDDALEKCELTYTTNYLLEEPLFNSWLKYANAYSAKYPEEKVTAIETLTRRFDDVSVAEMLARAKSKDSTRAVATQLETALLDMWLSSGKSVDDVQRLFKFHLIGDFTYEPLLHTWVSYVNLFLKKNPDMAFTILSKLEPHFQGKPLNQILLEAMKFPSMEKAAAAIQSQKIRSYLASNESPQDVFFWLNLDHVGDKLLVDSLFMKWLKYAKDFNKKNPKQQESLYWPVRRRYSDAYVERMIHVAMKNPNTVNIANLMVKERSKHWLDNKNLPGRIFIELDLKWTGEKTLASPNFKIWVKYLNDFNRQYPDKRTTVIDGLRSSYNDLKLVRILHAAKQDATTAKLATNLENALVNKWVAEKQPLTDLKKRFGYTQIADNLIERYAAKLSALARETS